MVPAQIENAHQERRRQRNPRHDRPIHHFLHFEHVEAESLAARAKNAVLAFGPALLRRQFAFQEFAIVEFHGQPGVFRLHRHHSNLFTALISSSGVKGFAT